MARRNRKHFLKHKELARKIVKNKIEHFNSFYNFSFNRISIKNQKLRWGSCSKKGNLNFNYRIIFLPQPLSDYLIAHELCHLGEFNHSRKFWNLVEKTVPNYKIMHRALKKTEII